MALTKVSWEMPLETWPILAFVTLLSYVSVTGVADRSAMLTGILGYRLLSFAFAVCIFILLAVSQGHSSQN